MRQSCWPRVPMAEHREPCESRGSRTVLGAPGGEIPPGDSTIASFRCAANFGRYWHLADNLAAPAFVRFWTQSGHFFKTKRRPTLRLSSGADVACMACKGNACL